MTLHNKGMALRRFTRADFALMQRWLAQPHVLRWWAHETSLEAIEADFGAAIDGREPTDMFVAEWHGRSVGFIQRYRFSAYPEYLQEVSRLTPTPAAAWSIDYLVGEPDLLRQGVGAALIRATVEAIWHDDALAPAVIVPVHADNPGSWRVLERAGFHRVAEGELEPDNPIDDRRHWVYRIDRPSAP